MDVYKRQADRVVKQKYFDEDGETLQEQIFICKFICGYEGQAGLQNNICVILQGYIPDVQGCCQAGFLESVFWRHLPLTGYENLKNPVNAENFQRVLFGQVFLM